MVAGEIFHSGSLNGPSGRSLALAKCSVCSDGMHVLAASLTIVCTYKYYNCVIYLGALLIIAVITVIIKSIGRFSKGLILAI